MVKFFVPTAKDDEQAQERYESIRKFVEQQMGGITGRRIFSIEPQDIPQEFLE